MNDALKIGIAQTAPVWLNKEGTLKKVEDWISMAADHNCKLLVFGEAFVPGYPFWLMWTDGAHFESGLQKDLYAHYLQEGVSIADGDLDRICEKAAEYKMSLYLGIVERAHDRGNHSLYCSLAYIDEGGRIASVHRKLQPTYEERLVWAPGDGHGLVTHSLSGFTIGGLNCWENWMPLSRTALYAQGENVHIATWPGSVRNTEDVTRYIAKEGRSFVMSASSLLSKEDIGSEVPHHDLLREKMPDILADGGSCVAAPDGTWLVPPITEKDQLITTVLDLEYVLRERQNFDPTGHYSRPDITNFVVDRRRQSVVTFTDDKKE